MLAGINVCNAMPGNLKIGGGFEVDKEVLTASIVHREAKLVSTEKINAGLYVFKAEFKNVGFEPLGAFAADVKTIDYKKSLSSYQWQHSATDWVPLVLYFQIDQPTSLLVRFGNWKNAQSDASLSIRNVSIEPVQLSELAAINWLADGDFDKGHVGMLPPDWYAKDPSGIATDQSLILNPSYRSGKHIFQIKGQGEKSRNYYSHTFPLPDNGTIEFSVWARADESCRFNLHIIRDGWGKRAEQSYTPTRSWKKYTITWPISKDDVKWFFLRIDKDATPAAVELADAQLRWHPAESVTEQSQKVDPYANALSLGWQGTPGPNLLYNPDLELGGTGFFYEYSWPKKYDNYIRTRKAQPIVMLENQGVDGGTCALLRNIALQTYCFPVTVGKTYTISADLKAASDAQDAQCSALAIDPEWHVLLWSKATQIPKDQWKRYSWTITWDKPNIQQRAYVNFGGNNVLIDRIQIVEGTEKEYQAPPVMLGLTFDRWPYFVRGRDQVKANIKIVPGIKRAGKTDVDVVAKDAWGNISWSKQIQVRLDANTIVPVDLPAEKLGTFHVNLTAKIDGQVAGIGMSRYAIIDPSVRIASKPGQYGLSGICQETFNFPSWLCEDHAIIQSDLGITLNRFFASVPPDLPMPIPAEFKEELLAKCRPFSKAGIELMPCIGALPRSESKSDTNAALDIPSDERLDKYARYLHAYVDALKSEIKNYEIFNEPNLWRVHDGPDRGKPSMYPKKYFEFQKVAYRTIKSIDPNLIVVCNAMNNVKWDWLNEWMTLGAGKYMDVFSYHPYGQTNFYSTGIELEKVMKDYGFAGQMVNSEKYYGANLFQDRAGYEETRRGYYLPHFQELATAGRSIQHFVSQAAVGMPVCFFNPTQTLSRRGPVGELFVYDFFSAYSTASRLMATAGRGQEIILGPSINAIAFPDDPDGLLVAIWSPRLDIDARMMLQGQITVMDIMGNTYDQDAVNKGVRIASDPAYIRFKHGTSIDAIQSMLTRADVIGLGDPFKLDVAITGSSTISVHLQSMRNQPSNGQVKLFNLPEDWKLAQPVMAFEKLMPGQIIRLDYSLNQAQIQSMHTYGLSAMAQSGELFTRTDVSLRPLFATRQSNLVADGNLSDWHDAQWIELSDENVSTAFSKTLKRENAQDLSAKMTFAWDRNALAIAVVVTDDTFYPAKSPHEAWQGDSIQLFLDPLNNATVNQQNTDDDVQYIISRIDDRNVAWLAKGANGNYKGQANRVESLDDTDVKLAIVRQGNQTIYEMIFPATDCVPGTHFDVDGNLGFSILINDNDGKGRKTGLTLAPKGSEPYGKPYEYCDLIFK
jgi:hypothetical protein